MHRHFDEKVFEVIFVAFLCRLLHLFWIFFLTCVGALPPRAVYLVGLLSTLWLLGLLASRHQLSLLQKHLVPSVPLGWLLNYWLSCRVNDLLLLD